MLRSLAVAFFFAAAAATEPLRSQGQIVDFFSMSSVVRTPLPSWLVSGAVDPSSRVAINGHTLPPESLSLGSFNLVIPLEPGINRVSVSVTSPDETTTTTEKDILFDSSFSLAGRDVAYVDVVEVSGGTSGIDGTILIDLSSTTPMGVLPSHIVALSPDKQLAYYANRDIRDTSTNQIVGHLPFSLELDARSFAVSPDGSAIFSRNEVLRRGSAAPETIPFEITTGAGFGGAPPAASPALSLDTLCFGVYASVTCIDPASNSIIASGIGGDSLFPFIGGAAIIGDRLLLHRYGGSSSSRIEFYDTTEFRLQEVSVIGSDFGGAIAALPGGSFVAGSAGNPLFRNGGVAVLGDDPAYAWVPLADDVAAWGSVVIASDGNVGGISVYSATGGLLPVTSFRLGLNQSVVSSGIPAYDNIRRILFKPGISPAGACDITNDSAIDAADAGVLFANWGFSGIGDCTYDGHIDAADAGALFSGWSGDGRPASVPEPPCPLLVLTMGVVALARRRFLSAIPPSTSRPAYCTTHHRLPLTS
jgi:hypothetical protein